MKKTFILLLAGLLVSISGFSQFTAGIVNSAESRALGGSLAAASGIQSLFGNPAGLTSIENFGALATAETRFAGTGILLGGAGAVIPSDLGVFGINLTYYGLPAYNEQSVGLSYARQLFESFSLSVQAKLFNTSIEEYGSQFTISGTLGLQAKISKSITVGTYIQNPIRSEITPGQFLPTIISIGAQYAFPEKLKLLLSIEKDLERAFGIQAGVEYQPAEQLFLRVGVNSYAPELSFGLGFKISEKIRIDAMAAYHQILGLSPGFTFIYQ